MGTHKGYQGHRNYNAWNVALYLFNDYATYQRMCTIVRSSRTIERAAERLFEELDGSSTPDGVKYTKTNVRLALQNWEA